jgi:hypothetical protein
MFPKFRTSTDRPAPMMIIPVRPGATASDAPAADRPASLLRRTLGKSNYSRRTLGKNNYSRRTFGRNEASRRTLGRGNYSRRTFGQYHP